MRAWIVLGLVTFLAAAPGLIFLPVLDRDEARYAQATTQMLETDVYVQINFKIRQETKNRLELIGCRLAQQHYFQTNKTGRSGRIVCHL